jgi:hypothetical protein
VQNERRGVFRLHHDDVNALLANPGTRDAASGELLLPLHCYAYAFTCRIWRHGLDGAAVGREARVDAALCARAFPALVAVVVQVRLNLAAAPRA